MKWISRIFCDSLPMAGLENDSIICVALIPDLPAEQASMKATWLSVAHVACVAHAARVAQDKDYVSKAD